MTKEAKILAVIKDPGKKPIVMNIDNTLKAFQNAVGGFIEVVNYKDGVILLVNEEGRLLHMPENILGIAGPIVAIRAKGEEFDSIRSAEVLKLLKELSE